MMRGGYFRGYQVDQVDLCKLADLVSHEQSSFFPFVSENRSLILGWKACRRRMQTRNTSHALKDERISSYCWCIVSTINFV